MMVERQYLQNPGGDATEIYKSFDCVGRFSDQYEAHLEQEGVRTIVFHGANEITEIAYLALKETNLELTAVIDDEKAGSTFLGHTVLSSQAVAGLTFDRLLDTRIPGKNDTALPLPVPRNKRVSMITE